MNETNLDYQLVTTYGWESGNVCVELGLRDRRCNKTDLGQGPCLQKAKYLLCKQGELLWKCLNGLQKSCITSAKLHSSDCITRAYFKDEKY